MVKLPDATPMVFASVLLIKVGSLDLLGRLRCVASVHRNAVYFIPTSSVIYMLGSI